MPENVPIYAVVGIAIVAIVLIAAIAALVSTFFTVQQRTTALVQRLGKFVREAGPGLNVQGPLLRKGRRAHQPARPATGREDRNQDGGQRVRPDGRRRAATGGGESQQAV